MSQNTILALQLQRERLERGWDYDPESGNDQIVQRTIENTLGTQLKADETRLRRRTTDSLSRLIEIMNDVEPKLPKGPVLDLVANSPG